ncbi:MAG: DNA-binding response regulator, partial [Pedosphaera sp.]|nr:DNA-binding response regulator [Pedosphaera sp.]
MSSPITHSCSCRRVWSGVSSPKRKAAIVDITVCIVEDDLELRDSVFNYLRGAPGFSCLGAYGSAEEALKEIPRQKPEVVLMDINLP